ncbi:MAG: hypothetical protein ACM3XN_06570 [Chloroflexota bacterium]
MLRRLRREDGAAMLLVLLMIAVLTVIGLALAELGQAHLLLVYRERQSIQALDLAEAGLNRAVAELWMNPGWTGDSDAAVEGAEGAYSVTIARDPHSPLQVIATSTGVAGRARRTVRGTIFVLNAFAADQGLMIRDDLAWTLSNLTVHGTTQIAGDLSVTGGRVRLYGQVTLAGEMSDPGSRVSATSPITEHGTVMSAPDIDTGIFHSQPWDLIDIDYPDGSTLDNHTLKGGAPYPSSVLYVAHIEGDGRLENISASNKLPGDIQLMLVVADGSLTLAGNFKPPKDVPAVIIAGGDITVGTNCSLSRTALIANGRLLLAGDLDVGGSVAADTVIAGRYDLSVNEEPLAMPALPIALQVTLLTWEEVTPP